MILSGISSASNSVGLFPMLAASLIDHLESIVTDALHSWFAKHSTHSSSGKYVPQHVQQILLSGKVT